MTENDTAAQLATEDKPADVAAEVEALAEETSAEVPTDTASAVPPEAVPSEATASETTPVEADMGAPDELPAKASAPTSTPEAASNGQTPVVTLRQLLDAGVHFGHQTRRWNPRMQRFIFGEISGIYIIDLKQTMQGIEAAYTFARDTVAEGGSIMFVGTKKQVQPNIRSYAERCGMPYVNQRWLGGTLTNFATIHKRVEKMREYQRMREANEFAAMPKKEALRIQRELEKLERNLSGIGKIVKIPEAIFVFDIRKEQIAVTEANKLNIPIIAVVDTNCDPDVIQYVIPGNDDAIRSGDLMCRIICDAVIEGKQIAVAKGITQEAATTSKRTPREEAEFQRRQAKAREQAALEAAQREARLRGKADGDSDDSIEQEIEQETLPSEPEAPATPEEAATQETAPSGEEESGVSAWLEDSKAADLEGDKAAVQDDNAAGQSTAAAGQEG